MNNPLYNEIGKTYDRTRRAEPAIVERLCVHLRPRPDRNYLDLGCGTGNYSCTLAERGIRITGLDVSELMINRAREKDPSIEWHIGRAEEMPFPRGSFSGAVCTLAIHHFTSLKKAFRETWRVLSEGRFVIFTALPEQMQNYWLNEYFPQTMQKSMVQMPDYIYIKASLRDAGFGTIRSEEFEISDVPADHFLYSGKTRPELYLDASFRSGISSFAALADDQELYSGLRRLEEDIHTGRIKQVVEKYKGLSGDYIFIIAEK